MTKFWIVRHRDTGEEQFPQCESDEPPYDPEAFEIAELPRELDGAAERWDWEAGEIACRFTPAEAAEIMWIRAKAYREERYLETAAVVGVVPDETIMVECDAESRRKVTDLALGATWAVSSGDPLTISFTDGAQPVNRSFTVSAAQTIAIKAAITLNDARCHAASQVVRSLIADALEAGATAEQIFAIDITAGYPAGPISPPLPAEEES